MKDPKKEPPIREREMPKFKHEPVEQQPANNRAIEGDGTRGDKSQGVFKDERGQDQPADRKRALQDK